MRRLLLLLILTPLTLHAQNQLVPADDAVQLRRVWTQQGEEFSGEEYGQNVWGGTDITGDSIADFAVYRGSTNQWLFYAGANPPAEEPQWATDSMMQNTPIVGDYLGNGTLSIAFMRARVEDTATNPKVFYLPSVYRLESNAIASSPWAVGEHRCFLDLQTAELDGEPGDELIVMRGCSVKEVWIYKGGPDFQLDTPMVIISDTGHSGAPEFTWLVRFADLDGDGRTDMLMGGEYPGVGEMLRFYFGDDDSPQSWSERDPDRDLALVNGQTGIRSVLNFGFFQLDAHPGADIAGFSGSETHLYLSSRANPRDRSFLIDAADRSYPKGLSENSHGYLNDSLQRYEMLPLSGTLDGTTIAEVFVSGASEGPDNDYEAWYAPEHDGLPNEFLFKTVSGVGDVTGDGYGDFMVADMTYGAFTNTGIAFVVAGGPHIPFDDPSTVVEEYRVAGESSGLYLWPNPVIDELHIAWQGNLKSTPARFAIYTVSGEMVVEGKVDPYRGEMIWRCDGVASGAYLLVAYDMNDNPIADARITKR